MDFQILLNKLGLYTGKLDGDFGRGTYSAVYNFQIPDDGIADGILDKFTQRKIIEAAYAESLITESEYNELLNKHFSPSVIKMMEIQSNLFDLGYDAYTDYEKAKNEFLCGYMDANKTVLEYLYHNIQTDDAKLDALLFWTQKAIDKDNTIYKIWDNPIISIIEPLRAGEPTIINIVNDSESISSVHYTILGPHHYYEDDYYLCGGDFSNIEYTFSTTLRYPGEYSILVSVDPNTPQERFAMVDFVVPDNLAPLDYIPNQRYGGEMIEIECYYNPIQGYTYGDQYMDENWVWHNSESTTRHIIKHTFENLDLTLYELPERPGSFCTDPVEALNGKRMGLIDKNSMGETEGIDEVLYIHPNFAEIMEIYYLDDQYGGLQVAWQWVKAATSFVSDICFVIKTLKIIQVGTKALKIIDTTKQVSDIVDDAITYTEAGCRVVDGDKLETVALDLFFDSLPVFGTVRAIIDAWDHHPNYFLYNID